MFDPDTPSTEEPDWVPPPPQPDPWRAACGRVAQVAILHAVAIGFPDTPGTALIRLDSDARS